jgi:ubiquinone/menaquinone biosynthesis C-methylase UbiE
MGLMNEREEHGKQLAEHFSTLTAYWKDIYTSSVESWDFFHQEAARKRKEVVLDFVDRYAGGRNLRILDSGCGAGVIMEALLRRGHQVCGIDIAPDMLRETAETLKEFSLDDAALREGTVERLDFPDRSFDLCLCIGVLQYLEDDELAIKELARVTKPAGQVIISLPNIARVTTLFDPYYYLCRGPLFIMHRVFRVKRRCNRLTSDDISNNRTFRNRRYYYGQLTGLFKRYGLAPRAITPIGYGPLTFWMHEYLLRSFTLRVSRGLERIASLRGFSFLKTVANRWVLVLQKNGD